MATNAAADGGSEEILGLVIGLQSGNHDSEYKLIALRIKGRRDINTYERNGYS